AGPSHQARGRSAAGPGSPGAAGPALLSVVVAIAVAVALALAFVALDAHELLDAPSVDRLAGVDVALRVDRVAVQVGELAGFVSRLAQVRDDRAEHAIHRVHDLVAAVDLEHVGLHRVVREAQVPRRARGAERSGAADAQGLAGSR